MVATALYCSVAASFRSPAASSARLRHNTLAKSAVVAAGGRCERKGVNEVAKELARTAELTAEAIATENEGAYTRVSPATLHAEEPDVAITPREGRQWRGAYLLSASGTADSYVATVRASNGNTFTLRRTAAGKIVRTAEVCGAKRHW
ncbi:MAG TPA: hypothetical protein VID48_12455 [Solirubrobacteraceae bacterium]